MEKTMKTWRIKYNGWFFEEVEAKTAVSARKAFLKANEGCDVEIECIEEKKSILDLFYEAENKIANLLKGTKHLEIDDFRGDDVNWFKIPVFYVTMTQKGPESKVVEMFSFGRSDYETEAEMVERFHEELDCFMKMNWKKIDR